MLSKIKLK